jgi:hypothetical protein
LFFCKLPKVGNPFFLGFEKNFAQWLCNSWHIAAISAGHTNGLEAESYSKIRRISENQFLQRWMCYHSFETGAF